LASAFTDSASGVFIGSSWLDVGGKIRAIPGVPVGGMGAERVNQSARVLPDTAPLIPVKAKTPKQLCQCWFSRRRNIQPNPFADDFRKPVLIRQPRPQVIQDRLGGQPVVAANETCLERGSA
jgi:hypothetical protein